MKFHVDSDITIAETLPAHFYKSQEVFDLLKEKVFVKSWQWIGDAHILVPQPETVSPLVLLEDYVNEPLICVRDANNILKCFTNVCTHRGNILCHQPETLKNLTCMYHGRRFGLDGRFQFMPEFKEAKSFPRVCDSLKAFSIKQFANHLFVGLEPDFDFNDVIEGMSQRIGFLPLNAFKHDPTIDKSYTINCHWALYCDNYLEGFHIPFVHDDLNEALDYGNYKTLIYDHFNLQIGYSDTSEDTFNLPEDHVDFGKNVAAYYYWIFPNMMFNFYPWGLSINIVKPLGMDKTQVSFITYVYDETKLYRGAGALLDKVEQEDEFVVEGVHKGLKSRYYKAGRFSPTREQGVHHFHLLLARYMNKDID